ncbi:low-specificity L-threonine aldolase [bacterium]|nr:low-specificity L-threonine aldolase [bacterium]
MIDLRSDTVTKPSKAMLEVMIKAEVGDDVFGEDPTINLLEEKIAELFGKEKALFVPSGTMGNQICLRTHTNLGDEVILDYNAHIFQYEAGSPASLSGIQLHTIVGEKGLLTVSQIRQVVRTDNEHFPKTKLVCLENTHNRGGGTFYALSQLEEIGNFCKQNNLKLHLDGARLFNAAVASQTKIEELAKPFDSVSVCLSKGLGCPIGSVIVGTRDFIKMARRVRKSFGGGMRQAGFLAAAGIFALENNVKRLEEDHVNAKFLAEKINGTGGIRVAEVPTNIVILEISGTKFKSDEEALESLKKAGILLVGFGEGKLRAVTHLDVSREQIKTASETICKIFKK